MVKNTLRCVILAVLCMQCAGLTGLEDQASVSVTAIYKSATAGAVAERMVVRIVQPNNALLFEKEYPFSDRRAEITGIPPGDAIVRLTALDGANVPVFTGEKAQSLSTGLNSVTVPLEAVLPQNPDIRTFQNDLIRVRFDYPTSWTLDEAAIDNVKLRRDPPNPLPQISIKADQSATTDLDQFLLEFKAPLGAIQILDEGPFNFRNKPSRRIIFAVADKRREVILCYHNNHRITFEFACMTEMFQVNDGAIREAYASIRDSFVFLP